MHEIGSGVTVALLNARDPFAVPRPRTGPLDATTTLRDFAIVTFDVDPGRLAAHLPSDITPEVVRLDDGRERALISAVSFQSWHFGFGIAPFARFSMYQVNYRAYIRRSGERGVWFFGTSLTSRLAAMPRICWRMPWYRVKGSLQARWTADHFERYEYHATGWGAADVVLEGTAAPLGRLDGFRDLAETALVLTHPLIGYFRRLDGKVGSYDVWHERLHPSLAHASTTRYAVFEEAGLVRAGQQPHSAMVQPHGLHRPVAASPCR